MDKLDGFNRVAPVYDALGRLVFGDALFRSQTHFAKKVWPGANVLIVGGGTGRSTAALMTMNRDCKVWYVEAASAMIDRARRNLEPFGDRVTFIHGTHETMPRGQVYDVVITYFFLDLFSEGRCHQVAVELSNSLKENGIWLAADFTASTNPVHRLLLRTMYVFFRITSGVEARRLPDWENAIANAGLRREESADFYRSFIRSIVFSKPSGRNQ